MISSEVQRTLVKSPPELWAELSDQAALARHLGELGEIRIVRTEPERVVEWTAEHTTGVVSIKPSGWGTRVTLSATRERTAEPDVDEAAAEEPVANSDVAPEPQAAAEPESPPELGTATEPQAAAEAEPTAAPESAVQPEPATESTAAVDVLAPQPDVAPADAQASTPEPRRGFFARLFRRRGRTERTPAVEPSPERPDAFAAVRQVLAPETFAAMHPFATEAAAPGAAAATHSAAPTAPTHSAPDAAAEPAPEAPPKPSVEPSTDIAAELMAAEDVTADEVSAAEVTAVLTAVLDRLGAAHHRPFSRG
jgi:hypothetical protein